MCIHLGVQHRSQDRSQLAFYLFIFKLFLNENVFKFYSALQFSKAYTQFLITHKNPYLKSSIPILPLPLPSLLVTTSSLYL